jgi:LysM repeat protein
MTVNKHRHLTIATALLILVIIIPGISSGLGQVNLIDQNSVVRAQGQAGTVLAFYYAWYDPSSFGPGRTLYQPVEKYFSTDPGVIQRHIDQARSSGIDGFVQSWYGPSPNQTESNFRLLLDLASASSFKAAVDFETGSPFYSSNEERISGLRTLLSDHVNHTAYLRVAGKPVIFFWANQLLTVAEWAEIRNQVDPAHESIWIAEGASSDYLSVFDGLHLYNIAWSNSPAITAASWAANTRTAAADLGVFKYWIATAMPGFNDSLLGRGEATIVRNRTSGSYYQTSFSAAAASNPDMLIINSFNEWAEASNIEPSVEFGNQYLELTGQLSTGYKNGSMSSVIAQVLPTEVFSQTILPGATQGPSPTPTLLPSPTMTPTPISSPTADSDGKSIYTVQAGDTLTWIADRFGVELFRLYELNELDSASILTVGQQIILGITGQDDRPADDPFPGTRTKNDGSVVYTVSEGDSLLGIADRFGLELKELLAFNSTLTDESVLLLGTEITVGHRPVPDETGGSTQLPTILPTFTPGASEPPAPTETQTSLSAAIVTPSKAATVIVKPAIESNTETTGSSFIDGLVPWFVAAIVLLAGTGALFLYLGREHQEHER